VPLIGEQAREGGSPRPRTDHDRVHRGESKLQRRRAELDGARQMAGRAPFGARAG
jgi:hypothetical protein